MTQTKPNQIKSNRVDLNLIGLVQISLKNLNKYSNWFSKDLQDIELDIQSFFASSLGFHSVK